MCSSQDLINDLYSLSYLIAKEGATTVWEGLKLKHPDEYNMLLLASLEMQAKELENLKGNT